MTRSRATAKKAGTAFESLVAGYLADVLKDDRIERRAKTGGKDRGDIAAVRTMNGHRVVIEAKDVATISLGEWHGEAETERVNDGAEVAIVVHKRVRRGRAAEQWATMTLADLAVLLGAEVGR